MARNSVAGIWLDAMLGMSRLMRGQPARPRKARRRPARKAVAPVVPGAGRRPGGSAPAPWDAVPLGRLPATRLRAEPDSVAPGRPAAKSVPRGRWMRSYFAAQPAPPQLVSHLDYGLHLPAALTRGEGGANGAGGTSGAGRKAVPLVVMLHGCRQTIESFARGTRMNALADREGFAVLYPQQSRHSHSHRCWRWFDPAPVAGGQEAAAIAALTESVVKAHPIDASRVYLVGMSAGAGMAMLLALTFRRRFAALALHSGPVYGAARSPIEALAAMRRGASPAALARIERELRASAGPPLPAMVLHGDADPVVDPLNAAQLSAEWLLINGLLAPSMTLPRAVLEQTTLAGRTLDYRSSGTDPARVPAWVRVCRIAGLGHAWSGGDEREPFHAAKGPSATEAIWHFFSETQGARSAAGQPAGEGLPDLVENGNYSQ